MIFLGRLVIATVFVGGLVASGYGVYVVTRNSSKSIESEEKQTL